MGRAHAARRQPALVVAAIQAGTSALAACGDDDGGTLAGVVRTPPLDVSDVSLPIAGAAGESATMVAPSGELYLVYFGYTSCPDICPTTMSDLSVALGDLPSELADRVTVAMTTVDPERDTDEILTGYLGHFFDDAIGLRTDDPAELDAAAAAFGVQYEVADHAPGDAVYDVAHTAATYVVDDTGTVRVEWPFGLDSESMASDLETLLEEEQP